MNKETITIRFHFIGGEKLTIDADYNLYENWILAGSGRKASVFFFLDEDCELGINFDNVLYVEELNADRNPDKA